jgi:spore germination protein PE
MSVQKRLSVVGTLYVTRQAEAAIVQIGDNVISDLFNRTIALQRAIPDFQGDETRFAAYSIFSRPILELQAGPSVDFHSRSPVADIRVRYIHPLVVTASALLRIGVTKTLVAESRIKHIRQFNAGIGTLAEQRE